MAGGSGACWPGRSTAQLADVATRTGGGGRLVSLTLTDIEPAAAAGLPTGGTARCLVVPAHDLPDDLWPLLSERRSVCLVTRVADDEVLGTTLHTDASVGDAGGEAADLFAKGRSGTLVLDELVVTALHPVPRMVIVGVGPTADGLGDAARAARVARATSVRRRHGHRLDRRARPPRQGRGARPRRGTDRAGPRRRPRRRCGLHRLRRARTRCSTARADWLAYRGITDLTRVHGPAGLDIGASSPPEVAVAVLAEALAVRSPGTGGVTRDPRRREGEMADQPTDGRAVLRSIWDAEGQELDVDEDCGPTKPCRNMRDVSFDELAEPGTDLGEAWRAKLACEGKLSDTGGTVRGLVLGSDDDS